MRPKEKRRERTKTRSILLQVASLFGDPPAITFVVPDHFRDEYRLLTFGLSRFDRLLGVSRTDREDGVRIISARAKTAGTAGSTMMTKTDSFRPHYEPDDLGPRTRGKVPRSAEPREDGGA